MGLLLLLAGFSLAGVAFICLISSLRSPPPRRTETGKLAHRPGHLLGRTLELMLLVPIVLMAVTPPAPLGAAAAEMRSRSSMAPTTSVFPPLPQPVMGAVPLTVSDFVGRALYDVDGSLRGIRVRLVGLVASDPGAPPDGFRLVRFAMFCCAADAIPMRIHVRGARSRYFPVDSWVEVIGAWRPTPPGPAGTFDPSMMPTLDAVGVRSVPEPSDPYDPPF